MADMAYEWMFHGVNHYELHIVKNIGGELHESFVEGDMTPEQIEQSDFLVARFADYVNSLGLEDGTGTSLELSSDGSGSFRNYVTSFVVQSAQRALDQGADLSGMPWITVENSRVTALDLAAHARYATRMKQLPAFDQWDLRSPENELFGTAKTAVPALHGIRESPQYSGRGAVRLSHSRPDESAHLRQRGPFSGVPSLAHPLWDFGSRHLNGRLCYLCCRSAPGWVRCGLLHALGDPPRRGLRHGRAFHLDP